MEATRINSKQSHVWTSLENKNAVFSPDIKVA